MAATLQGRPSFDTRQAADLAGQLYGIRCEATELASYSDQNFRLTDADGLKYVLKIANTEEPAEVLDFQQEALQLLAQKDLPFKTPYLYQSLGEEFLNPVVNQGKTYQVWMISYQEGQFMADLPVYRPEFLQHLGYCLGRLDQTLAPFQHPAMHRTFMWDLKQVKQLTHYLPFLDATGRLLVESYLDRFEKDVQPFVSTLRQSVVYNDANDHNILVDASGHHVTGLIDFGDMVHTYTVSELAIAGAYAILGQAAPIPILADLLEGYQAAYPLTPEEKEVYFHFVCLRLCTSVCLSAERRLQEPDNTYLTVSEKPAWDALRQLSTLSVPRW